MLSTCFSPHHSVSLSLVFDLSRRALVFVSARITFSLPCAGVYGIGAFVLVTANDCVGALRCLKYEIYYFCDKTYCECLRICGYSNANTQNTLSASNTEYSVSSIMIIVHFHLVIYNINININRYENNIMYGNKLPPPARIHSEKPYTMTFTPHYLPFRIA